MRFAFYGYDDCAPSLMPLDCSSLCQNHIEVLVFHINTFPYIFLKYLHY